MTILKNNTASVRIWANNPDHHLFNNNGTWWVHYTTYPTPATKRRVRRSLKTNEVGIARQRRDAILAGIFFSGKEAC
jgi:hypothetical protein